MSNKQSKQKTPGCNGCELCVDLDKKVCITCDLELDEDELRWVLDRRFLRRRNIERDMFQPTPKKLKISRPGATPAPAGKPSQEPAPRPRSPVLPPQEQPSSTSYNPETGM